MTPPDAAELPWFKQKYSPRWLVSAVFELGWVASGRTGSRELIIAARTLRELAGKLDAAEQARRAAQAQEGAA